MQKCCDDQRVGERDEYKEQKLRRTWKSIVRIEYIFLDSVLPDIREYLYFFVVEILFLCLDISKKILVRRAFSNDVL